MLYLLGHYPVWSETFLRQDLGLLLERDLPIHPLALFSGDTPMQRRWPHVQALTSGADEPAGSSGHPISRRLPSALRGFYTQLSLSRHRKLIQRVAVQANALEVTHIHAEFGDLPGLVAAQTARELGLSYSIGLHARDIWLPKFSEKWLYGEAAFLTVCNKAACQCVLERNPQLTGKTHLLPHGIDLAEWPYDPERPSSRIPPRLLFVGRFVAKKGIMTLLNALRELHNGGMAATLTLTGAGWQYESLCERISELGLTAAVRLPGVVPHSQIQTLMLQHDMLIVPSEIDAGGDQDGLPNVVLEAMSLGLPVVGTPAGSLPEILTSRTGWVFAAGDAASCAAAVRAVCDNPGEAERKRKGAREVIETDYSAQSLADRRAELFRSVLNR